MQEHVTKVELYGDIADYKYEHKTGAMLLDVKANGDGTKTFLIKSMATGKILIKFQIMETENTNG